RFDCLGNQAVKNVANPVMSYRVVQGDETTRPPRSRPDVRPAPDASRGPQVESGLARAWDWYLRLPRLTAAILAIAGFLFLINVFTGLNRIWFHWPVAALLLIAVLWAVLHRKPSA